MERGRAPSLHVVELDDTGNFTPEQAARLETFIYDADDTGSPRGLLWWTVAGAGLGLGALIYGLWLAFDTWVLVP